MAYDVHLDIFEGPLDLLLYLIKKNDLEVSEIPIAQITTEYLSVLGVMKDLNLEVAGDFLVMASTLMQIKARMLLPLPEGADEEAESELDELKARLEEYQKFKEVAQLLGNKESEFANIYYHPAPAFDKSDFTLEVSLYDLIASFKDVLTELPTNVREIVYEEIPIEQKIRELLDLLEGKEFLSFIDVLKSAESRIDLIVTFLAVLELIRLKQIIVRQKEQFGEVRIYKVALPSENMSQEPELFDAPAQPQPQTQSQEGQEVLDFSDAPVESAGNEQSNISGEILSDEINVVTVEDVPLSPIEPGSGEISLEAAVETPVPVVETITEVNEAVVETEAAATETNIPASNDVEPVKPEAPGDNISEEAKIEAPVEPIIQADAERKADAPVENIDNPDGQLPSIEEDITKL
jgi:segregation and condensation protein A